MALPHTGIEVYVVELEKELEVIKKHLAEFDDIIETARDSRFSNEHIGNLVRAFITKQ